MLSWQLGDPKENGGGGWQKAGTAATTAGHCCRHRRGGRDPLVPLLAAAAVVQLCALAVGGAWVLLRLRALEASHGSLREACISHAGNVRGGNEAGHFKPEAAVAAADALGDYATGAQKEDPEGSSWVGRRSYPWKRSAASPGATGPVRSSGSDRPGDAPPTPADDGNGTSASSVAHFVFGGPGDNEYVLDPALSRQEQYQVMVPRGGDGGVEYDRWYPKVGWYLSGSGKLMHLAAASWLAGADRAGGQQPLATTNAFGVITVTEDGLYLIYAQVCFVDAARTAGYVIKKTTTANRTSIGYVASCETAATARSESEARRLITCPVTTVHRLTRHDRLTVELTVSRRIYVRHDYTFVGLVRVE